MELRPLNTGHFVEGSRTSRKDLGSNCRANGSLTHLQGLSLFFFFCKTVLIRPHPGTSMSPPGLGRLGSGPAHTGHCWAVLSTGSQEQGKACAVEPSVRLFFFLQTCTQVPSKHAQSWAPRVKVCRPQGEGPWERPCTPCVSAPTEVVGRSSRHLQWSRHPRGPETRRWRSSLGLHTGICALASARSRQLLFYLFFGCFFVLLLLFSVNPHLRTFFH